MFAGKVADDFQIAAGRNSLASFILSLEFVRVGLLASIGSICGRRTSIHSFTVCCVWLDKVLSLHHGCSKGSRGAWSGLRRARRAIN
jgi:hypothetical protein